ncbi:hypothetical protein SAMN04489735_101115 [Aneurinibacillus thermoaerophilus]|uniref:Uncharacterized protein n=1 Tax=Aneurinibacillus thermoaerophilus TaxID=143495 RepID=A0A1G7ZJT6_ANETH|nr:hypothetical protein SAMN04489735_101115 [Aneurinibacillus thermoaerophilus]
MDIYTIEAALFIVLLISSPFLLYSFANVTSGKER